MNKLNLINNQPPEFGNPEHIKYVKKLNEILTGNINCHQIDWQPCISNGNKRDNGKPKFKYVLNPDNANSLVDFFRCPRCQNVIYLLINYDSQDFNSIIQIDLYYQQNGVSCSHCKTEFEVDDDRCIYCKPKI
jgi:hypothetical protein